MKVTLLGIIIFLNISIFGQVPDIIFDEITYEDGVELSWIYAMHQDSKGFVWIGVSYGLFRYDGYEFVDYCQRIGYGLVNDIAEDSTGLLWVATNNTGVYVIDPETDHTLHLDLDSLEISAIRLYQEKDGTLWIATRRHGLLKLEPSIEDGANRKEQILKQGIAEAFAISRFFLDEADSTGTAGFVDLLEDLRGLLWTGTQRGLYTINRETGEFLRMDLDGDGNSTLMGMTAIAIAEENPDMIWVKSSNGFTRISNLVAAYNGTGIDRTKLVYDTYPFYELIAGSSLRRFYTDSRKNLWYGSLGRGLIKIITGEDGRVEFQEVYPDLHQAGGTMYDVVTSMMEDRTGLLWTGHEKKGIRIFRENNSLFTPLQTRLYNTGLNRFDFNQVLEDEDGNVWVCAWGSGVYRLGPDGSVENYRMAGSTATDTIGNYTTAIMEIEKGVFWVGGFEGVWQLNASTGRSQRLFADSGQLYVRDIEKAGNHVLIASTNVGMVVYNLETRELDHYTSNPEDSLGFRSNNIRSITLMRNGDIWTCTANRGLNRFRLDPQTGKIIFLPLPDAVMQHYDEIIEPDEAVIQVHEDQQGLLWFATSSGLVRLDTSIGELRRWRKEDGLSSFDIYSMEEDNHGNLWLGTWHGLSMLDMETGIIRTFSSKDGLPEVLNAVVPSSYKNNEGQIYFSGTGGFYRIDPDNLYHNELAPPVAITDLMLFNEHLAIDTSRKAILTKNISYTEEIRLKYNQHDLTFTFAALDFNDPEMNRYGYRLEGYEEEWTETGADNRLATYTNLGPGEYVFRVRASNRDGVWNEEGTFLRITIRPPFWKTMVAYIIYGILLLLLLRIYIFWRTRRLRKEKMVLERQVNERTADLKEANEKLEQHQDELQEVNTLLEEQREELMQQKEELQVTLENLQKTQEQLVESEKMAAVGGLVAGVAHEINTPVGIGITAITNLMDDIERMAELYEKDKVSHKDFKDFLQSSHDVARLIQKNLERTAALVQSFKQVSADQVTEQQRVFKLKDYLHDILLSLQPKFRGKDIQVHIDCDENLKLNSYPGVFAQIFTNLLQNSLQHGFREKDAGNITIRALSDKTMLKIDYRDDGSGISQKDLPHIFEPFYTSDQQSGSGLGLNIVYNLVRQKLHGSISCESEPDQGVIFHLTLPFS